MSKETTLKHADTLPLAKQRDKIAKGDRVALTYGHDINVDNIYGGYVSGRCSTKCRELHATDTWRDVYAVSKGSGNVR